MVEVELLLSAKDFPKHVLERAHLVLPLPQLVVRSNQFKRGLSQLVDRTVLLPLEFLDCGRHA